MVVQAISAIGGFASLPFVAAGAAKSWLDFQSIIPGTQPVRVASFVARFGSPLWVGGAHAAMGTAALIQGADAGYRLFNGRSQDPMFDMAVCLSSACLAANLLALHLVPQRLGLHWFIGAVGIGLDLGFGIYHSVKSSEFPSALAWNAFAMGLLCADLRHIQALYRAYYARRAGYAYEVTQG